MSVQIYQNIDIWSFYCPLVFIILTAVSHCRDQLFRRTIETENEVRTGPPWTYPKTEKKKVRPKRRFGHFSLKYNHHVFWNIAKPSESCLEIQQISINAISIYLKLIIFTFSSLLKTEYINPWLGSKIANHRFSKTTVFSSFQKIYSIFYISCSIFICLSKFYISGLNIIFRRTSF